jgi:hypothetical protein
VSMQTVIATDGGEPTGLRKGELARPRGGSGQVEMGSARGCAEKLETKELKQTRRKTGSRLVLTESPRETEEVSR